jgi:CRP/FNR family transcriptional regulator, cyclic AMP receptor protein
VRDSISKWPEGSLLSELTAEARDALLSMGTPRRVGSGHVLIREGEDTVHVVLLRQAYVKVTAGLENGREALINIRASGDVVGELSALDGGPRSATVTTCGQALVNTMTSADFRSFLGRYSEAALILSRRMAGQLRFATRRRADFTGCHVGTRLARVLVEIADTYGHRSGAGVRFAVTLTQEELGAMVGAAEDSVHRELRKLAAEAIVDTKYRNILVLDMPRLRHHAKAFG